MKRNKGKEVILSEPYNVGLREYEVRDLEEKEVRLDTIVSGVSQGAEIKRYRGLLPNKNWDPELRIFHKEKINRYPLTMGYECVSLVTEIGKEVKSIKPKMLIWIDSPHRDTNIVSEEKAINGLLLSPNDKEYGKINPERFVFYARTRVALGAIHDASIVYGEKIAVIGLGVIGLIIGQIAKLNGAIEVYGVDITPKRLEFAESLGIIPINANECDAGLEIKKLTGGKGVDVAIEASGVYKGLHEAIRCCHKGGRVITVSSYSGVCKDLCFDEEWLKNRITMTSSMTVNDCPSRRYPLWDLKRLNDLSFYLLKNGIIEVEKFITHRFNFEDAPNAYNFLDSPKVNEVLQTIFYYKQGD